MSPELDSTKIRQVNRIIGKFEVEFSKNTFNLQLALLIMWDRHLWEAFKLIWALSQPLKSLSSHLHCLYFAKMLLEGLSTSRSIAPMATDTFNLCEGRSCCVLFQPPDSGYTLPNLIMHIYPSLHILHPQVLGKFHSVSCEWPQAVIQMHQVGQDIVHKQHQHHHHFSLQDCIWYQLSWSLSWSLLGKISHFYSY